MRKANVGILMLVVLLGVSYSTIAGGSVDFDDGICIPFSTTVTGTVTPPEGYTISYLTVSPSSLVTNLYGTDHFTLTLANPGMITVTAYFTNKYSSDCTTSPAIGSVTAVGVKSIEITANGSQDDVTGRAIKILQGTKYTFTAKPDPSDASWPPSPWYSSNYPRWTGVATGSGSTIEATFSENGDKSLTAACGASSKSVSISVLTPKIIKLAFTGQQIQGGDANAWIEGSATGHACFVQGKNSTVQVTLKLDDALTYSTGTTIFGDVDFLDEWTVGDNYAETPATLKDATSSPIAMTSESATRAYVHIDGSAGITWKYKVPSGDNSWYNLGATNGLEYYLIYADQKAGTEFKYDLLKWSCQAAEGKDNEDEIRKAVNGSIYSQYTYAVNGNCYQLASNFVWATRALGINTDAIVWASPGTSNYGDMRSMKPTPFTGAGGTVIPPASMPNYAWGYHEWAQSGGKQYDPSAGNIFSGSMGGYEDIALCDYSYISVAGILWQGKNYPGQTQGCEGTGIFRNEAPVNWTSP